MPTYEAGQKSLGEGILRQFGNGRRQRLSPMVEVNRGDLTEINKVWFYLVNSIFKPSKHVSTVRQDRASLLYELVKRFELNVGKIIKESILDYVENKFSRNIPYPSLITLLCIKGGVKLNKAYGERYPKASPLPLTRALKAPIESEKGERREKREE